MTTDNGWATWKNYVLEKLDTMETIINKLCDLCNERYVEREKKIAEHELKLRIISSITFVIFSALVGVIIKILLKG